MAYTKCRWSTTLREPFKYCYVGPTTLRVDDEDAMTPGSKAKQLNCAEFQSDIRPSLRTAYPGRPLRTTIPPVPVWFAMQHRVRIQPSVCHSLFDLLHALPLRALYPVSLSS